MRFRPERCPHREKKIRRQLTDKKEKGQFAASSFVK
jgi:hypothetical protein